MKKLKVICDKCGEVEIEFGFYTDAHEEQTILPVGFAPRIQDLGRLYKKYVGESYESRTGNKINESFEKKEEQLVHLLEDDEDKWDYEKDRCMFKTLCWVENY